MGKIAVTIDGKKTKVEEGTFILDAARGAGIEIPVLCNHPLLSPNGACRLCLVEIEGRERPVAACAFPVEEEISVLTRTPAIERMRKTVLELLVSDHPLDCMTCEKSGDCLLEKYAYEYGVKKTPFEGERRKIELKDGSPFIVRDYEKCILCGRCVKICGEVVGADAIDFGYRGFETGIISGFDGSLQDGNCINCGSCIQVCPVGALRESAAEGKGRSWEMEKVKTVCPYCGVGCGIECFSRDGKIIKIAGDAESPVNAGLLCIKGKFGSDYVSHPDRLLRPLKRVSGERGENSRFEEIGWAEAMDSITEKFKQLKKAHGPDALAGLSSAKCTNEENYLFQKFIRTAFGTNNVDHCARLCHSPSVSGLLRTLGSGAMTNSLYEIEDVSDCIVLTGTNVSETQPVTSYKIRRAVGRGAKLIVIDPRGIDLCSIADMHLQQRTGTDVMLFNALAKIIIDEGLTDNKFIDARVEGFAGYRKSLENFSLPEAGKLTGVPLEKMRAAARMYANAGSAVILWAMGITQHITGTDNVCALSNLALLAGQIGKEGAGLCPLRGQNNVQGACDMGALPDVLPGYQKVSDAKNREKFSALWKTAKLPGKKGLTVVEIFENIYRGNIKGLYSMGENPVVSDPDSNHIREALKRVEFMVVQDIFLSETAKYADFVLPAACSFEKEGTFTNTERRVQKLRKCVPLPGEAKPDWQVLKELAGGFGLRWAYRNSGDILREINSAVPSYAGITPGRIAGAYLQWPCADKNSPGTRTLHEGSFPRGRGKLVRVAYNPPHEMPDDEYPFTLTTGRILSEYHTRTMTGRVKGLKEVTGKPFCVLNSDDARRLQIKAGDKARILSRRGDISLEVRLSQKLGRGVIFVPFHFGANVLTHNKLDQSSKIPEYKVCACRLEKTA